MSLAHKRRRQCATLKKVYAMVSRVHRITMDDAYLSVAYRYIHQPLNDHNAKARAATMTARAVDEIKATELKLDAAPLDGVIGVVLLL